MDPILLERDPIGFADGQVDAKVTPLRPTTAETDCIDYRNHTNSELPGLPPITPTSHLKPILEELYWSYVRQSPGHLKGRITDDLVRSVYSGALDDRTVSKDSFPYVADECTEILNGLEALRDHISDDLVIFAAARLWADIANHKDTTNLGRERAQEDLSRGLKILMGNVTPQTAVTSPTSNQLEIHAILEPGEMQRLVDAIDEIRLSSGDPFLHRELMIKITTNTGIIPTKSHLRDVVQMSPHPEKMTEGANVSRGVFEGNTVALKKPRHHSRKGGPGAVPGDVYREYYILSMLNHPHINHVLGIFVDPHDSLPAMVSPYMCNGTMGAYLESNPGADRLRLLAEAASGFAYMHSLPSPVVHCDVRSANILIDAEGKAVLIDFGSSILLKPGAASVSPSHGDSPGTLRWMAPEALRPGDYPITPKVDVWSFACLIIEVFSGKRPFDHIIRDGAVVIEVLVKNRRPPRPQHFASARQLIDPVWVLMEQSWKLDPSDRPSMADIHRLLSSLSQPVGSA